MNGTEIVLGTPDGRAAAALLVDGRLDDLLIDPADDTPRPGTIFRGICDRPVKGQGGMFLRLGEGRTGWLKSAKGLQPGQAMLVQVTGWAEPGKALPLTDRVLFKSRHCIVTPGAPGVNVARGIRDDAERERLLALAHDVLPDERGGTGAILRSACEGADEDDVAADLEQQWQLARDVIADEGSDPERLLDGPDAHELAWRDWPAAPVAEEWDRALDAIAEARGPRVELGPVTVYVEPTRALVAVDVNTPEGGAGGLRANLALARELPRLLRLRGLGGQIVLDLAPMPKKDRRTFESAIRAACKADAVETSAIGWTPLGHYELTRRRERRPLEEMR